MQAPYLDKCLKSSYTKENIVKGVLLRDIRKEEK